MGTPIKPRLSVVPGGSDPRTVADRIRHHQAEARALANELVTELDKALADVARLAAEISDGGEVFAVGVREIARRLAEDTHATAQMLAAVRCKS
jgi:preprotein translocase subunit SecA